MRNFRIIFLLAALSLGTLLTACLAITNPSLSATQTAVVQQGHKQATRMAELLQDTQWAALDQQTATVVAGRTQTAQAELDQQATIDAAAATEAAYLAQLTAEAIAMQQLIQHARSWPAVVQDPFDKHTLEWPIGSEEGKYSQWTWEIVQGKYLWHALARQAFTYWVTPSQETASDFYLAVDARYVDGDSESEAGLVFLTEEENFWCFLVSGEGDLFVGRWLNGDWEMSLPFGSSHVNLAGSNHLAVISLEGRLIFLINGESYIESGFNQPQGGPAGLMLSIGTDGNQASWEFDNYELRVPGAPVPPTTPTP